MRAIPSLATPALKVELFPNGEAKLRLSVNATNLVT